MDPICGAVYLEGMFYISEIFFHSRSNTLEKVNKIYMKLQNFGSLKDTVGVMVLNLRRVRLDIRK